MNIGQNILNLRKSANLSQEQLAEKMGVTRQTISNWELDESSPNINQTKKLAKAFNVNVTLLIDDTKKARITSNAEKLAGIVLVISKIATIMLILSVVAWIFFRFYRKNNSNYIQEYIVCKVDDSTHSYSVTYKKENGKITNQGGDLYLSDILNLEKYKKASQVFRAIDNYVSAKNGTCEMNKEYKEN